MNRSYEQIRIIDWKPSVNAIKSIVISLAGLITLFSCHPSELLYKEHALYNFKDQGFLSKDLLQTTASSPYPQMDLGSRGIRQVCIDEAIRTAKKRVLRVFLHTYFRIPPTDSVFLYDEQQFYRDYPVEFSGSDYIRAEIDFAPLLKNGFIALQDSRGSEDCYVVFRIIESDLPNKIRSSTVSFIPDAIEKDYSLPGIRVFNPVNKNRLPEDILEKKQ